MRLIVEEKNEPLPDERIVEIVERKGIGHPDTICDALAEEVSRALSRYYLERFGRILHHNVDKALLCGGSASPRFGGGEVTAPIEVILAGRATRSFGGVEIPVERLAVDCCRSWLRANLHALDADRHVKIECRFRPGSGDLVDLFGRGGGIALANDTSIGVGFAPMSPLEQTVLDIERWINDRSAKQDHPELGEDVKVMGVREEGRTRLTIACAFTSAHIDSVDRYLAAKERLTVGVRQRAAERLRAPADVVVNAADDPAAGSIYVTVTGTSAEAGDDGQVGRGNRVNGLITPGRAMTLEAAAGKNPVSHVGKLYNVAAGLMARECVSTLSDIRAAECTVVSRIGAPVDEPQVVSVRLRTHGRPVAEYAAAVAEIGRRTLSGLPALSERLVAGELTIY